MPPPPASTSTSHPARVHRNLPAAALRHRDVHRGAPQRRRLARGVGGGDRRRARRARLPARGPAEATTPCARGLEVLDWLIRMQTVDGVFSPVGNRGWFPRGGVPARFDQQPIEACATAKACADALRVSGDERWRAAALLAVRWFEGGNVDGQRVYDCIGSCAAVRGVGVRRAARRVTLTGEGGGE